MRQSQRSRSIPACSACSPRRSLNVILNRVSSGVESGDGGVARLMQAMRAHANFTEQAPIALIVIACAVVGIR